MWNHVHSPSFSLALEVDGCLWTVTGTLRAGGTGVGREVSRGHPRAGFTIFTYVFDPTEGVSMQISPTPKANVDRDPALGAPAGVSGLSPHFGSSFLPLVKSCFLSLCFQKLSCLTEINTLPWCISLPLPAPHWRHLSICPLSLLIPGGRCCALVAGKPAKCCPQKWEKACPGPWVG